jgi:hypothetical protein
MARKRVKRVCISVQIDVELAPEHEQDDDVKASLQDAIEEWQRREWRIHGREPGQFGPNFPPPSGSGETVELYFSEDHPTKSGHKWGTMRVSWQVYDPEEQN